MTKAIGIDLGTTNSVAAIRKVETEIIKNSEGEFITPSCVNIQKKKFRKPTFVVGRNALEWLKQDPENTITAIKRLVGRSYHEPEVEQFLKEHRLAYKISRNSKGSENSLVVHAAGQEFTAEEISAEILAKIKADTEKREDSEVGYAVITVPAYFNDKQKHGTRIAAARAGLKVQRLLPEPTAAAISFGVDKVKGEEAQVVLVFDFGGGTLDLSVLTISGGQFIEQGKGGDMWLGGDDIDRLISDYILDETAKEYEIEDIDTLIAGAELKDKNRFLAELKSAVEQAKISLSTHDEAWVEVLGILHDKDGDSIDVEVELTRARFDELMQPVISSIMKLTDEIIENIHFTPDLIDKVLLVGGSSKIPLIISSMQEKFGSEKVMIHERPMLAIAEGAAILSHRLADTYECPGCGRNVRQADKTCLKCDFNLEQHTIDQGVFDIVHSAAHDYFIQLADNQSHLLIEKNTPLPCSASETFTLVHAEQRIVHLKFFNIVNQEEQSIGDLWLGIDEKQLEDEADNLSEDKLLQVELTINIDENNLVEANTLIKDFPAIKLSKTLSRGNADEKLFVMLEELIDEANRREYGVYVTTDLESRVISVIRNIEQVVEQDTDQVDEKVYSLATMKIEKAARIAAEGHGPRSMIYYAQDILNSFVQAIPSKLQKQLKYNIAELEKMDEYGSYDENIAAHNNLKETLDDDNLKAAEILSDIKHAGLICAEKEPARAPKFFKAINDILQSTSENEPNKLHAILDDIMPEVNALLSRQESETQKIFKDIKK